MGFVNGLLVFFGFGVGCSVGVLFGYLLFIYFKPTDAVAKDVKVRPLVEYDSKSLERWRLEVPLWVKSPDYYRIDWVNSILEQMWPYLDKAICGMAKERAEPIIAENAAKYKIGSVEFKTFTLGSLPLTFHGMKVCLTDEKELIVEPSIKWAGNPNITVVVKAYGLKATIQVVVDLQIFALPRITLKPLIPRFPCFAKIFVSLLDKPHIDFGLKFIGADLMAIPGLYRFAQETIKNQVVSMYGWPKPLEVTIMDPSKALKKPVGILHVKVARASNLRKKDFLGKSDPYVRLKMSDDKVPSKKTTVKHNTLNPEWNEEFKFTVTDPETQYLDLSIYDWEQVGKHDKMGTNVVHLRDLTPDETKTLTLNLLKSMDPNDPENEKPRGEIVLEAKYRPFKEEELAKDVGEGADIVEKAPDGTPQGGGLLVVIVHDAQDLEGKHHTNPYVQIFFKGEGKKTKRIKKNRDPKWEEEFHFVCEEPPINEKLHVEVYSKPSKVAILSSKESLGYVDIGLADAVGNRRTNEKYDLIGSKSGRIQIELQWRPS
uniref:Synaptotagmin-2 n=1 Tax=Ananas comosus var. bracteatus TaxID=296719 RepID=A0A6V7QD23_ANACO|nr:unnamed protein product [Ananas comosus var. bracteatus]